ncbi:MAG: hypothetical protein JW726_02905 [Anaerolineales bacterium]|nr:hypothetical protein [Anaerolineales bacterium]
MRRYSGMLFVIILLLSMACQALQPAPATPALPTATLTRTPTSTHTLTHSPPTFTPQPVSAATATPLTPTNTATTLPFRVQYHPDNAFYVGDLVSLEVIPAEGMMLQNAELSVQVDAPDGPLLGTASFAPFGIQGRLQATMIWAWDTWGMSVGEHTLTFTVAPHDFTWSETVTLLPGDAENPDEANAHWASVITDCCALYYITGTAAERDLTLLAELADDQADQAIERMGVTFSQPITITLLPRLLGHGGFASREIHVSYLERNYAANAWDMVVLHEMIHILDQRLGGDLRPSLLVEGLAVYLTGGHFKPEPLLPRAAALLEGRLDWYIPLNILADDFYASQHEIGYLQAGALVQYMVERWGWEAYSAFYRDIHPHPSNLQSAAINTGLQAHFGLGFAQLEADFIAYLQTLPDAEDWEDDVRLTVQFYDTLRRYQQALDPGAYFATAWLLDSQQMRQRQIVADYLRHPSAIENIALETLLIAAGEDLSSAPYESAGEILSVINQVLAAIETGQPDPFAVHPLADDYFAIAQVVQTRGYQVERIEIDGNTAYVLAGDSGLTWVELRLQSLDGGWELIDE